MADYSDTPLVKKLGVKPGTPVLLVRAPAGFGDLLEPLPDGAQLVETATPPLPFVVLFVEHVADLLDELEPLARQLAADGTLWVAWPKKASGISTDLSFDVVQQQGLGAGLVDTKICAIDGTWSGLKFVFRLEDRSKIQVAQRERK